MLDISFAPRRSSRLRENAIVDMVGDTAHIHGEGAFAGESLSLTLCNDGHWRFTHPNEVRARFPWAVIGGRRTKEGVLIDSQTGRDFEERVRLNGFDEGLHAKELLGPELRCVHCGYRAGTSVGLRPVLSAGYFYGAPGEATCLECFV